MTLPERLADRIRRQGPLPFDSWMEAALYDPEGGFFATGGGAGRAGGDFITSPEVGGLFGRLVARALDEWWDRLGHPDPFVVVEAGAGRGRLAVAVLAAEPACASALRYVLVERSQTLRDDAGEHLRIEPAAEVLGPAIRTDPEEAPEPVPGTGPIVTALAELPAGPFPGLVVANELFDNLPFRIVERHPGGWDEVRVGGDDPFEPVTVPADEWLSAEADAAVGGASLPDGARLPVPVGLVGWLRDCRRMLRRGAVIAFDYGAPAAEVAGRPWLRTFRSQQHGGEPWDDPGSQDITADMVTEALERAARRAGFTVVEDTTQADWLRARGLDALVTAARETWHGRTVTDLAAIRHRSLVHEADALTDPSGLGAHRVWTLACGAASMGA
jgi:SAM-dependent MidA family methyltransferase